MVAVVLDQSAAGVVKVASELHTIGVHGIHGGNERLAVVLDDNIGVGDSGVGKLRVGVGVVNVVGASNDVQANTVGVASRGGVVVMVMIGLGRGSDVRVVMVGIVMVVIVVVAIVMLGLVRDEVVVRVAVVGDQGAASVVAGDLDLVGVDLVMVDNVRVAVNLDHRLGGRDSSGSQLWVGVRRSVGVATGDVELDAVGACGLIVMVVMVVGVGVGLVMLVVIVVRGLVISVMVVGIPAGVRLMHVAAVEGVVVVQLSGVAGENFLACGDHVGGEGELLAVKHESLSVVIEVMLRVLALLLEVVNGCPGGREVFDQGLHVLVSLLVVQTNLGVLVGDILREVGDVVRQTGDALLEGLKGDHKLSLDLDALLVVVLVPDLFVVVEVPDLVVEVSGRKFLTAVLDMVIGVLVAWMAVVVVAIGVCLRLNVARVRGLGLDLSLRLKLCGMGDGPSHSNKRNSEAHYMFF